jgi:hypothetical protein
MDPVTIQFIKDGGLIVGLMFLAGAMMKGLLWPKAMVDRVIEAQQKAAEQSAKIIATEIKEGMQTAVTNGISIGLAKGVIEVRKINSTRDDARV